jgi:hypothetical protein
MAYVSIGINIQKTHFCSRDLTAKILLPVSFCNIFSRLIFPINLPNYELRVINWTVVIITYSVTIREKEDLQHILTDRQLSFTLLH